MLQTWRWFGPNDPVKLSHVRQAGATGIVSALHQYYRGEEWPDDAIAKHKALIEEAGLTWSVVESIPVPAAIKLGNAEAPACIERYKNTIRKLAANGIETICYNFMPVVDWTRTNLRYEMPNGALALRFDAIDFAAYDCFVLKRKNAEADYDASALSRAEEKFQNWTQSEIEEVEHNIISGLPGSELSHDRDGIRQQIEEFDGMSADDLHQNLISFLQEIVPVAEEVGARLCIHPDDPPIPLFGLPRVVGRLGDYEKMFEAIPSLANGMTLCTGSLASRRNSDLSAIVSAFAERIHFVHLRNVAIDEDGSFYESDHLDGDVDMVAICKTLMAEERRRKKEGRPDWQLPLRPDHGHLMLDDIGKKTNPGYSAIGRLRGLAELRGVMTAIEAGL